MTNTIGIMAVLILVFANGFFVASEFSLVAVRRSRVVELAARGKANAAALLRAVDRLDANLAATQLGITLSSLGLGWIGEPALAHLIEPLLVGALGASAESMSHAIAVAIAFTLITTLHIVLGELAPKSLALQRSERTALWIVRPLALFRFVLTPAIFVLNGLGNRVLRLVGLQPGTGEGSLHSPEELRMLAKASAEGGLLHEAQRDVVERIFSIGGRSVGDAMTTRTDIVWINAEDSRDEILRTVRECRHEQILVSHGEIDNVIGVVRKQDMLDQALDGRTIDPMALVAEAAAVHEASSLLTVLEQFKKRRVRLAIVVDEYGSLQGIVTPTDLMEAIAGDMPTDGEEPEVVPQPDGSLIMDGRMDADEALVRLGITRKIEDEDFRTLAGFCLQQLRRIPAVGDQFDLAGWRFEITSMDGRRIDKVLATPRGDSNGSPVDSVPVAPR